MNLDDRRWKKTAENDERKSQKHFHAFSLTLLSSTLLLRRSFSYLSLPSFHSLFTNFYTQLMIFPFLLSFSTESNKRETEADDDDDEHEEEKTQNLELFVDVTSHFLCILDHYWSDLLDKIFSVHPNMPWVFGIVDQHIFVSFVFILTSKFIIIINQYLTKNCLLISWIEIEEEE